MTSNLEIKSLQVQVSNKNLHKVSSGEETFIRIPSEEIQLIEKHSVNISSPQNTANKSESSRKNETQQNQNKETKELLQHDMTIKEDETVQEEEGRSEIRVQRENNHSDNEDLQEGNKNCCTTYLLDILDCVTWYFRIVKNSIISCFRCRGCCNCNNNYYAENSSSSGELDVNYIYSDQNETFNDDRVSDDIGINIEAVETTEDLATEDISTNVCSFPVDYDEPACDNGRRSSGDNVCYASPGDDAYHNNSVNHNDFCNVTSGHVSSGGDTGYDYSGGDTGYDYSGGDTGGDYSGGDVGGDYGGNDD